MPIFPLGYCQFDVQIRKGATETVAESARVPMKLHYARLPSSNVPFRTL